MFILSATQNYFLGGSYICILYAASDETKTYVKCQRQYFVFESRQNKLEISPCIPLKVVIFWSSFDGCC
jgi:hypothetical protein